MFVIVLVFPLLQRSYDAAVMSAGFVGFGLGATPTAMANMTAVTQRHGASTVAFPAISTGVYGYPVELAADVAVGAVRGHGIELVRFVLFGDKAYSAFARAGGAA